MNAQGTQLALSAGPTQGNALLVDASSGDTVHTLRGHRGTVTDIRFSPDGSLVGSASVDGELIVWDTATGRSVERWDTFDPWGIGFSPDNDLVYGGGGDSMLRTWDRSVQDTYLQQTTQVGGGVVEVRLRGPLARRATGGLRLARQPGPGMGHVRRHRHRGSDAPDPVPGVG